MKILEKRNLKIFFYFISITSLFICLVNIIQFYYLMNYFSNKKTQTTVSLKNKIKVKVGTINIYNVNIKWKTRLKEIAKIIIKEKLDIVGLQEVRVSEKFHQVEFLMKHLPTDYSYFYHKEFDIKESNKIKNGHEEGLAIITSLKIDSNSKYNFLQRGIFQITQRTKDTLER
jgi:hypothetical protein